MITLRSSTAWFSAVGRPLATAERAAIEIMIRGQLLLARAEVASVGHWHEAGEIVRAADGDGTWWNLEEEERARLWECAADRVCEDDLLARLRSVTQALAAVVQADAAAAAERAGGVDPGLIRAASDAALMAAHQRALADFAGEADAHFFSLKYALFAGGRWPLGYHRGKYVVF